jgi:hypothetical protein
MSLLLLLRSPSGIAYSRSVADTLSFADALVRTATVTRTPAEPTAAVYINCGGAASGIFAADEYCTAYPVGGGGLGSGTTANVINTSGVINPPPQAVYQSMMWIATLAGGYFTYTVPGFTPGAACRVRLHFAEFSGSVFCRDAVGARLQNISINGVTVLTNYDVYTTVGADTADTLSFTTTADGSGNVTIKNICPTLTGISAYLSINGIEVTGTVFADSATASNVHSLDLPPINSVNCSETLTE